MRKNPAGHSAGNTDWVALARYLAGESSDEEREIVDCWLAEDPRRSRLTEALSDLVVRARVRAPLGLDVEGALDSARKRPSGRPVGSSVPSRASRPAGPLRPRARHVVGWRVAVGIVLFLGAASLFRVLTPAGFGVGPGEGIGYLTAIGERQEVVLPDGTRAILGPRSALILQAGYGLDHRAVTLEGEALFEVATGTTGPFTVHAAGAVVRDLGTAFTVRAYVDGRVEVLVTEGMVSLLRETPDPGEAVVLRAGDRGVAAPGEEITRHEGAVPMEAPAWTRGELVFRDASMERVAEDLQRWYGLQLRMPDEAVAVRRLTASFAGESSEQVARVIGLALGVAADLEGDTVLLRTAGADPRRQF